MSIEIAGEILIAATQPRVWEALNDPAVLQSSIVGCQALEKVSDTDFNAIVTARVGPIATTFRGSVALSDLDPPNGYTLTGQGQGGAAGFAKMTARVSLQPRGDQTLLRYTAQAEIGGKLASVGNRLVQGVARKNADDFFAAFARHFAPATPQGTIADSTAGAPAIAAGRNAVAAAVLTSLPGGAHAGGGLGAPVPAWLVLFGAAMGTGLGYCLGLLLH
jgi:carbon monoxide dehydrogenase subunit G